MPKPYIQKASMICTRNRCQNETKSQSKKVQTTSSKGHPSWAPIPVPVAVAAEPLPTINLINTKTQDQQPR